LKPLVNPPKTKRQEFLTDEQREMLLAHDTSEEIRFILMFGFFAGLRDGEMLAMTKRWIWISPEGVRGTVTVQNENFTRRDGRRWVWWPKLREMRTIQLHTRLLEYLKGYGMREPWMLRPQNEFWPPENKISKRYDAHKSMALLVRKLGLPQLNYHILRHSFATHLAMKGVSLADIAGLLGDSLKVTEETYAGYCPGKANPLSVL
jgi:integrase